MEFLRVREYLDRVEKKDEVNIEDALLITLGLSEDLELLDLSIGDAQIFSKYLRQWSNLIKMLIQQHEDRLVVEKGFSRLEKICNFLKEWECQATPKDVDTKEDIFDIGEYLSEKESDEDKFIACMELQSVFNEHAEFFRNINDELAHEKKKLAIDMLQME